MMRRRSNIYKQKTNIRLYLIAIFLGILFLVLYAFIPERPWFLLLFRELAGVIFAAVTLSLIWDFFQRRDFIEEILSTQHLVTEIDETGLIGISSKWHGEVDWDSLFKYVVEIDIFYIFATTWFTTNREAIARFVARKETKVNVLLPDPENEIVISYLAHRMNMSQEFVKTRIESAKEKYEKEFTKVKNGGNRFSIWYSPVPPLYSYYRFDGSIIVTFYDHTFEKAENVPTLMVRRGGSLYQFFQKDIDFLFRDDPAIARKVFPKDN